MPLIALIYYLTSWTNLMKAKINKQKYKNEYLIA